MAIIASSGGTRTKKLPPEGNHSARCFQIIHTGTVYDEMYKKDKNRVRLSWELPEECTVFKDGDPEKPFVVNKQYSLSLDERSTLRKDSEAWRGRAYTDDELKGYDVEKLINQPCMLQIIHSKNDYGISAKVINVSSVPKGYTVKGLYNDTLIYDVDKHDKDIFNTLPSFIQDEIKESYEWKKLDITTDATNDEPSDDLPF